MITQLPPRQGLDRAGFSIIASGLQSCMQAEANEEGAGAWTARNLRSFSSPGIDCDHECTAAAEPAARDRDAWSRSAWCMR